MDVTKGMIDRQYPSHIDENKLKELLAGCFQDVIISLACNDIGSQSVVRVIDLINNRIENANLVVDTGV